MLQVRGLTKSFGDNDVLRNVSFDVGPKERVALVGPNGVGKSTLLKALVGIVEADRGQIHLPPSASVGYLPQDACCDSETTVHDEMLSAFSEVLAIERRQRDVEGELSRLRPEDPEVDALLEAHGRLQQEFERLGGFEIEERIGRVLHGLGFESDDYDRVCSHLSGGWQMRVALAKLLVRSPDLLLLDEPTNHLDLPAIEWLESYLREYRGALIVVSHDRFFLDQVTRRTLELEDGIVRDWAGNYSYYIQAKSLALEQQRSAYNRQQVYLRQQQAFVERFRASARRSGQAKSREKMLEKIERISKPQTRRGIHFRFPPALPSGREVLMLDDVAKSYGNETVFAGCTVLIERGDRVALVGENGAGKTTLLRLLAGEERPDCGTIRLGYNVCSSHYTQDQADSLDEQSTVLDEVYRAAPPDWTIGDVRDLLGAFLLSGDAVFKRIGVLSGGERSRVALAKMLLRPANLLLLDEPTNHLDIPAREMLEAALAAYDGTVVFVSHDRYFISRIANRIIELADPTVRVYDGDYAYFCEQKERMAADRAAEVGRTGSGIRSPSAAQPTRVRQPSPVKLLATLEQDIAAVEEEMRRLEYAMTDPALYLDGSSARETVARYDDCRKRLDELNSQWEELALRVEAESQK